MSRYGARHWIKTKLHYLNGTKFTFAVHLIANKYRGCAYTLTTRYKEYRRNSIIVVMSGVITYEIEDFSMTYNDISLHISLDKVYYHDRQMFSIRLDDRSTTIWPHTDVWIKTNGDSFKLSDPNDLWQSIQELALWVKI